MTVRSDKTMAAVIAAVQEYLDEEARRTAAPQDRRSLSRWKSTDWRTLRDTNHHPANLWKHGSWR